MKIFLFLVTLCFALSSDLAFAEKIQNLDIVMGGFNSCRYRPEYNSYGNKKAGLPMIKKSYPEVLKSNIYNSYIKHRPNVNPYIMTCLTYDVKNNEKDLYDFDVYVKDSSREKEFLLNYEDYLEYIDWKIKTLKSKNKNLKINVYGHSYGGWMSIQLVKELSYYKFNKLITVDPISKPLCRPKNVLKAALSVLPFVHFDINQTKICNQFPVDITINELDDIHSKTGTWVNFYQDKTASLHSSEAPISKVENIKVEEPHIKIDNDQKVWIKFFN